MNDLEREIEFLLIDQKQDWKLARENYGSLTNVQTRYFQDPGNAASTWHTT